MVGFEAMKEEAVKRMKKLELHSDCIAAFEHDNQVWESEFLGALFELNDEKKACIKEIEDAYGCLVYHTILTPTDFGTCFSMLYVTMHTEEWEMDNDDLDILCPCVYVKNLLDDTCSEFGSIMLKKANGGLIRIG